MLDPHRNAILQLLDDDDAATVALVQHKLVETESPARLRELCAMATGRAADHLQQVLAEVESRRADEAFSSLCARFGEYGDLEQATWALASAFYPGEGFRSERELLDDWGREVAARLSGRLTKAERVRVLADFLGREKRLRGNDDDYYSVENSLLPRVIQSGLGIPISLSLIYMLVAKRAGFQVDGVGLPGHFLARHEDVFFDPFHGGQRIGLEECAGLMEQQNLVLTPQHLAPTTPRQMLLRMLTNLYYIAEQSDPPLATRVEGWTQSLRRSSGTT